MTGTQFVPLVAAKEIAEKSFATFDANGVAVLIYRFRDEYFAVENLCSHAQSTFDDGRVRGYQLICPLHGGTFDVRDGCATGRPARDPIRVFPLRIVDGMIEIAPGSP